MIILLSVKVTITFFFVEVTVNCTSLLVAIAAAIYEAADFDSGFVFVNTNELLKIDIPDQ